MNVEYKRGRTLAMLSLLRYLTITPRSLADIQAQSGYGRRHVQRFIAWIKEAGWHVERLRRDKVSYYLVMPEKVLVKSELVNQTQYAQLCGVHKTSIRDRIKSGTIVPIRQKIGSRIIVMIDINQYPPTRKRQ